METVIDRPRAKPAEPKIGRSRKIFSATRIKRILVPIDFSRMSLKAIPYALAVSRQFRANLHLLHVVDTTQYISPSLLSLAAVPRAEWNERLFKRLQAIALKYRVNGNARVLPPRHGSAHSEICAAARRLNADLIVIATHGYSGFRRSVLGSTAERVVQYSPCPVLVVRYHSGASSGDRRRVRGGFELKKILVPTDFSGCANTALNYAIELARDFDSELELLHVIDPNAYPFGDEFSALHASVLIREASRTARKRMVQMLAKRNVPYSVQVKHGSVAPEICEAANRDVDLIVTSTHGRTGIGHVLTGSIAEKMVRYARCPMLVIPARFSPIKLNSGKLRDR